MPEERGIRIKDCCQSIIPQKRYTNTTTSKWPTIFEDEVIQEYRV